LPGAGVLKEGGKQPEANYGVCPGKLDRRAYDQKGAGDSANTLMGKKEGEQLYIPVEMFIRDHM